MKTTLSILFGFITVALLMGCAVLTFRTGFDHTENNSMLIIGLLESVVFAALFLACQYSKVIK